VTLSALYALDTRTSVGINYQYSQNIYSDPGIDDALNGHSDTAYLSLVRRFNPRLSLTLNGGYTIRNSGDGTANSSPSGSAGLVYNYGPVSSISLNVAQSLTEATVGVTGSFSAQENTTVALQVNHRLTAKLSAVINGTYAYSSFTAPLPGITLKPSEQSATAHLGFNYAFSNWLSAVFNYSYTEVVSSESAIIQPYDRNQVSLGMTLSY
jgi:predicted porin